MASFAKLLDQAMTKVEIGNEKLAVYIDIENTKGEGISAKTVYRWRSGKIIKPHKREYILDMIKPLCFVQKGKAGLEECNALLRAANKFWGLNQDEQKKYFPDLNFEPLNGGEYQGKEKFSEIRNKIRDQTHFIEDKIKEFVGRQFVFEAIEQFITTKPRGYFIVRGDPGIGKSALSAQFVKTTGCVHHFNVRAEGISTASKFLTNICAQLIVAYDLDYQTLSPETTQDSEFLSNLLGQISKKLSSNEKLIIVVDALDEVDTIDATTGTNVLYLPITLPTGVYILATMRRDKAVNLRIACEYNFFDLKQDDGSNIADISKYITQKSEREGIQTYISKQQIDNENFVVRLTQKSQGNFMYLSYVLPEIEEGAYTDLAFDVIPDGLQGYYWDHWQRMKGKNVTQHQEWFDYKLPVVLALTQVKKPVSIDLMANFSGILEHARILNVLAEWDQFLYKEELLYKGYLQICYRIYHDTFNDFLKHLEEVKEKGVDLEATHKKQTKHLRRVGHERRRRR